MIDYEPLEGKIKIAKFKYGPQYAANELAEQIIKWIVGTGAKGGVIGISGGIDSTTVAYLTKYTFDGYNLEDPYREQLKLLGLILPSKSNSHKDTEDGIRVATTLKIDYKVIPIGPLAEAYFKKIPDVLQNDFDKGNLYSEIRAIVLSRYSGANNYRVMGTGNRDEDYILGYFTKRGDGAVDNNILGNIPKRLVRELATFLGVPDNLVTRIPTAGLWAGQTDEGELGYNYNAAEIIQNGYDEGKTSEQIQKITCYDMKTILDVNLRHRSTEHKRQSPPVGKITLEYV